jgi:hypothetical protein
MGNTMPHLFYTPQTDPVPTIQEAGWTPGLVWKSAKNLAPLGFDHWTLKLQKCNYYILTNLVFMITYRTSTTKE